MKAAAAPSRAIVVDGQPAAGQNEEGALGTLFSSLLHEAWALVHDHLLLAALELQRAGRNITRMIFAGVVAAILCVTGWMALVASVVSWFVAADVSWAQAFLAIGLLHVAICVVLAAWIRRMAAEAAFSATLRQLRPHPQTPGEGE